MLLFGNSLEVKGDCSKNLGQLPHFLLQCTINKYAVICNKMISNYSYGNKKLLDLTTPLAFKNTSIHNKYYVEGT